MFIVKFLASKPWSIVLNSMSVIASVVVKELIKIMYVKYARPGCVAKIILQKDPYHFLKNNLNLCLNDYLKFDRLKLKN